jgi:hypothetical protein
MRNHVRRGKCRTTDDVVVRSVPARQKLGSGKGRVCAAKMMNSHRGCGYFKGFGDVKRTTRFISNGHKFAEHERFMGGGGAVEEERL